MAANRARRAEQAKNTLAVLQSGSYNLDGEVVDVARSLKNAVDGTEFLAEDTELTGVEDDVAEPEQHDCQIEVTTETTLEAGWRLRDGTEGGSATDSICILNFASAKNPGGGFLGGSQAQEESLARSSGLYACDMAQMGNFYEPHRKNPKDGLYSHAMLYSREVPFFRRDDGSFCPVWLASVITSPAPNAGVALQRRGRKEVFETLHSRVGRILRLARARKHTDLVLGAFGCGVFKNDPEDVAGAFHDWLCGPPNFARHFDRVVFAVAGGGANYEAFVRRFN